MATRMGGNFQRQATGLVREAGTWSALIYNVGIDGVLPARFSSVSDRYHPPTFSLVVVGVLSIGALVVYATNPDFTTLVGIIACIASFMIVSVAAILFPYRRRAAWEASPMAWRFGGVPVLEASFAEVPAE